jgi:hypothetical protein
MMRRAILIDERDRRLGTVDVPDATLIIRHRDSVFVRTAKAVKLRPNDRAFLPVFEEAEVYVRERLNPL